MADDVAILITNYNMPEAADALCEHIHESIEWPHWTIVVDNGSDLIGPAKYTTLFLESNQQTTAGWLAGLKYARQMRRDWLGYMFLITSASFPSPGEDTLTPMAQFLKYTPGAVGIHPALTEDSTTAWMHMITRGGDQPRRTWMMDNIASLYRASWFDETGGFDPELYYGWGIDVETCWRARATQRSLWIDERVKMRKISDVGYSMGRMNMTALDRRRLAGENTHKVLDARYGPNAWARMMEEFVNDEWR